MGKVSTVISWLLLTGGTASAQAARLQDERLLPQWLTGIIAVSVFLFLVFIAFLVNKAWCDKSSPRSAEDADYAVSNGAAYDRSVDADRSSKYENVYENPGIDSAEDRVTAM